MMIDQLGDDIGFSEVEYFGGFFGEDVDIVFIVDDG